MSQIKTAFTEIYAMRKWGNEGRGSGPGSNKLNAASTRRVLEGILADYDISSMIDASCGAIDWTEDFLEETFKKNSSFKYLGIDVVESVIEENSRRVNNINCRFVSADLAECVPDSGYSLILCRDTFQHLSYRSIAGVLRGFDCCGARLLLISSFNGEGNNREIADGGMFKCDLWSDPFEFHGGLIEIFDDYRPKGATSGHKLNLYDARALFSSPSYQSFRRIYGK